MAGYGYGSVPDTGFSAFGQELTQGAWKDVDLKKGDEKKPIQAGLLNAPRPVAWKLRTLWCIAALDDALGASAVQTAPLDAEWDAAQRAFDLFLLSAAEHNEAAVREAAGRLRKGVLSGAGAAQTKLDLDAEVDFGRQQLSRIAKAPFAADAAMIPGIDAHLQRIEAATEALAKGIGRGTGQKRPAAPSKRLREALSGCSTAFNAIHDDIAWHIEHTPSGKERDHLEALHAPFLALLERYPPRAAPSGGGDAEETPGEGQATTGGAAPPEPKPA
jgi:hypothetical protein